MGSQAERRILQLTTLQVISQIITLQTSIKTGRKSHLKMRRDLRKERSAVSPGSPPDAIRIKLGCRCPKNKTKQNSLARHNFSLHIKEAPRWATPLNQVELMSLGSDTLKTGLSARGLCHLLVSDNLEKVDRPLSSSAELCGWFLCKVY